MSASESWARMQIDDSERLAQLTAESKSVSPDKKPSTTSILSQPFKSSSQLFRGSLFDIDVLHAREVGPEIFSNPSIVPKIKPFQLKQIYGLNTDCNILNLSSGDKIEVFFSSGHIGVLYDYCSGESIYFEGHHNKIIAASNDDSGNYIATADSGEDSSVIIWCAHDCRPVFTIFNIYPRFGCLCMRISYDAKYLMTIGLDEDEEHYSCDLWLWTYGPQKPHSSVKIKTSYGLPKKICYHPTLAEHVMFIFEKQVFFLVIDSETKNIINLEAPHITFKSAIGILHSGTYIHKRHRCFVTSEKGCVLIFANTLYLRAYTEGDLDNSKIYLKAVKITKTPLIECRALDELIALGDPIGRIYLMDLSLTIRYYYEKEDFIGLRKMAFSLIFKDKDREDRRKQLETQYNIPHIHAEERAGTFEDRCEEVFKPHPAPSDYTVKREPISVLPFFVMTENCCLFLVDYFKDDLSFIFPYVDSPVTAIETHRELPLLMIGHENGRLKLLDYEKQKIVSDVVLQKCEDYDPEIENPEAITCIAYSNESLHLVCSNNTGEIFVLDTILLTPFGKKPIRTSTAKILKLVFNFDSSQFAYYDIENTVVIFQYKSAKNEWAGLGKLVPHYLPITDILFIPEYNNSSLVTIGEDRYIVKYNNVGLQFGETFEILIRERIEQSAIPECFVYFTKNVGNSFLGYYIVADNQYKFKLVNDLTMMTRQVTLGPAYGAFKGYHISKLMLPETLDYKYYIFMIDKQIGLQKANLDGNPYSYVGYSAHPTPVTNFVLSHDGKFIFTFSEGYKIVFMWEIRPKAVELVYLLGGREFEPYYCLLEGGKNGWLFQEIQDLFFYMQILHQGENVVLPRKFSDMIDISELPDLVRACGYYPSEFEIENLMIEARYRNIDETAKVQTQITFFEFLKLYVNHRPPHGYSLSELEETFDVFSSIPEDAEGDGTIYREEYLHILTKYGEGITMENLKKCFSTLSKVDETETDSTIFSESIDFDSFTSDILGIEMDREKVDNEEDSASIISIQSEHVKFDTIMPVTTSEDIL